MPSNMFAGEGLSAVQFSRALGEYLSNPLFGQVDSFVVEGNPFRRPVRPQDIEIFDFSEPLDAATYTCAPGLMAQRMLMNIYETDLLFLPKADFGANVADFRAYYADGSKVAGEMVRPLLERHLFDFLNREIDVSGPWNVASMDAFFDGRLRAANSGESEVVQAIESAHDPAAAAEVFLVQLAGDFLTEASAMARNVLGNYGQPLSELFKVLIDEYGYGVHETKHSSLFEETLASRGLSTDVHAYWQFYLGTSISLINYFHYVSRNHANFFRYLGALLYTEATLPHANHQQSRMLRGIFGDDVDTRYFDEHVHIDPHHTRMARENIIKPVVERCGEAVIPEIVRGLEEFRLLQDLADRDLIEQICFADDLKGHRETARAILANPDSVEVRETARFTEPEGELSVTHVHDDDELFVVEDGALDFVASHAHAIRLGAGDAIVIPKNRLHGTVVVSESCTYSATAIERHRK